MLLSILTVRFGFKERCLFYYDMAIYSCKRCGHTFRTMGFVHSHINSMKREEFVTQSGIDRADNLSIDHTTLDKVEVPQNTFTSDSICYDVYNFYNILGDKTKNMFPSLPSLRTQPSKLNPTCAACVS